MRFHPVVASFLFHNLRNIDVWRLSVLRFAYLSLPILPALFSLSCLSRLSPLVPADLLQRSVMLHFCEGFVLLALCWHSPLLIVQYIIGIVLLHRLLFSVFGPTRCARYLL